jgi:hypothetical protein
MAVKEGRPAPQIAVRRLPMPEDITNATVEGIRLSRRVVGMGRPVKIQVAVRNYGKNPVSASRVQLAIEGVKDVLNEEIKEIPQNASQVATFEHRFEEPGPHLLTATFLGEDEIDMDNQALRVVEVVKKLPVLIVEGAPSARLEDSGGGYTNIALSLEEAEESGKRRRRGDDKDKDEEKVESVFEPTVIEATELSSRGSLEEYRAVILANVPRLPGSAADKVAEYVSDGGGLLVLPGALASPAFYNEWVSQRGTRMMPGKLPDERTTSADPVMLALKSFSHAAIRDLIDGGETDAASVGVSAYWFLESFGQNPLPVRGALDNGAPLLLEKKVDKGIVLATALTFDNHDSNMPKANFFVPFVHELVYRLAEAGAQERNVRPGAEIVLAEAKGAPRKIAEQVKVLKLSVTPDGKESIARPSLKFTFDVDPEDETTVTKFSFTETVEPGLYRFQLPAQMGDAYAGTPAEGKGVPFVVTTDPAESKLSALADGDLERIKGYFKDEGVQFEDVKNTDQLKAIIAGGIPGEDLWKYMAIAALLALVGEIALTRWIAAERKVHSAQAVTFGTSLEDVRSFRARAKALVAVPGRGTQGAGK